MQNNSEKFKANFIICPICFAKNKGKNQTCSECNGLGVGTFHEGYFLYWKQKYNRKVVKFNKTKRNINKVFNASLALTGVAGFGTLSIWVGQRLAAGEMNIQNYKFWLDKHEFIFLFWASTGLTMFAWFRYSNSIVFHEIKKLKNGANELPNNWGELKSFNPKYKIDVATGFNKQSLKIIEDSFNLAEKEGHTYVNVLHVTLSLLNDKTTQIFLKRLNVNLDKLRLKIKNQLSLYSKENKNKDYIISLNQNTKKTLIETYLRVYARGDKKVYPLNLLLSLHIHSEKLQEILFEMEVDEEKIENCLEWLRIDRFIQEQKKLYSKMARFKPGGSMDRAFTAVATPILDFYSTDLTRDAKWGKLEYCVNREKELESIISSFQTGRNACLLVGEEGVGKKTLIEKIAKLMVAENVPNSVKDKRLLKLDINRLISGASPNEVQERLLVVLDETKKAGNILLYIEDIESITGLKSGEGESLSVAGVLANAIDTKDYQVLATINKTNYKKSLEGKPLGKSFDIITVDEPKGNFAIQILESKVSNLENKYKIFYTYNCLEQIVYLSNKYINKQKLPQKAIEIMEQVGLQTAKSKGIRTLATKNDAANVIANITGIPLSKISQDESKKLLNLEKLIHKEMIGQSWAVNSISASLRRARVALREQSRPIASFLFLGPTGVGKTHLAKTVAKVYFGSPKTMIRLDMSEYQHEDSVKKIIGAKDGTTGYLTSKVEDSPFSLILLDEIEKANPKILDLFLQILDDGRLTNGEGNTIDFSNTIIVATSNIGSVFIQEQISIGVKIEEIKDELVNNHLNKHLRPEMINRFDGVVVFKPLKLHNIVKIGELMLSNIEEMLNKKGILLEVNEQGLKILAKAGFDPSFGARPLRRVLQERVENLIADKLLAGLVKRRDTIIIDEKAEIKIKKAKEL